MFVRESWYVFGWTNDLDEAGGLLGRVIIGEPVVVWRDDAGGLHAMEDRCPHRHAPLSMGRIEGEGLRCMYHGMLIAADGRCAAMPLVADPPAVSVRTYPVVDKDSWLWVWMGQADAADEGLIPDAFGIDDPERPMRSNSIEYDANYQLLHDNLCDLSHLDFVHATTLRVASGAHWSQSAPRIRLQGRAVRFERWFENALLPGTEDTAVDVWSTYDFALPGIFVMRAARYPSGTATAFGGQEPVGIEPIVRNVEQQAVTPVSERRTAYHYATGLVGSSPAMTEQLTQRMDVVIAAFEEDRAMIEGQQRIWDLTAPSVPKAFLPQDKGPHLMRQMIKRHLEAEARAV
jgi:vanillate O-demethylase monooxygenase subunit